MRTPRSPSWSTLVCSPAKADTALHSSSDGGQQQFNRWANNIYSKLPWVPYSFVLFNKSIKKTAALDVQLFIIRGPSGGMHTNMGRPLYCTISFQMVTPSNMSRSKANMHTQPPKLYKWIRKPSPIYNEQIQLLWSSVLFP